MNVGDTLSTATPEALTAALTQLEAERDALQRLASQDRDRVPLCIERLAELNAQIATLKALTQLATPHKPLTRPAMKRATG